MYLSKKKPLHQEEQHNQLLLSFKIFLSFLKGYWKKVFIHIKVNLLCITHFLICHLQKEVRKTWLSRYFVMLMTGIATGLVALIIHLAVEYGAYYKFKLIKYCILFLFFILPDYSLSTFITYFFFFFFFLFLTILCVAIFFFLLFFLCFLSAHTFFSLVFFFHSFFLSLLFLFGHPFFNAFFLFAPFYFFPNAFFLTIFSLYVPMLTLFFSFAFFLSRFYFSAYTFFLCSVYLSDLKWFQLTDASVFSSTQSCLLEQKCWFICK